MPRIVGLLILFALVPLTGHADPILMKPIEHLERPQQNHPERGVSLRGKQ